MLKWEDIKDVEPMVEELLTYDEVVTILSEDWGYKMEQLNGRSHTIEEFDQLLHGYPRTTIINNATYKNWDDSLHEGVYILHSTIKDNGKKKFEEFFMERTYSEPSIMNGEVWAKPAYHKLLRIHTLSAKRHISKHKDYTAREIAQLIVHNATIDNCTYDLVDGKHVGLHPKTAFDVKMFESTVAKKEYDQKRYSTILRLNSGNVPAGDELWDDLLCSCDKEDLYTVFKALRAKGHNIHLDGERDSFGWVTCGIVMDGQLMTSTYF